MNDQKKCFNLTWDQEYGGEVYAEIIECEQEISAAPIMYALIVMIFVSLIISAFFTGKILKRY